MTDEAEVKTDAAPGTPASGGPGRAAAAVLGLSLLGAFALGRCSVATPTRPTSASDGTGAGPSASESPDMFVCPMHPQIRLGEAGKCPICGMDLSAEISSSGAAQPGQVVMSARARELARLQVAPVQRSEAARALKLVGTVVPDERRLRAVTAWTGGRIDNLKIRTTGERVRRGQVVAELYSPELYAATRDYLVALQQRASATAEGRTWTEGAVKSARARLELLGMQPEAIDRIEQTGKAPKTVKLRSPFSGTVIARRVETGNYVEAGSPLLSLADLSRVWVEVEAFESDLPLLAVGQRVTVTPSAQGGKPFSGTVTFIDPVLDMSARTAKVRVEVSNEDGELRPGMFVQAQVESTGPGDGVLSVPDTAVLWTGRRSVVFVERPDTREPTYELREVVVGPRTGSIYPVLSGLSERERVVVRGAFVLDADLQLRGQRSMMDMPGDDEEATPSLVVTDGMLDQLQPVVSAYLDAQATLAADQIKEGRGALERLAKAVTDAQPDGPTETRETWSKLASDISGHARVALSADSDAGLRREFESISEGLRRLLVEFGNPLEEPVLAAFCPMAFDNKGAGWFQREGSVANPYYGAAMLRCGEVSATLRSGERLARSDRGMARADEETAGETR